MLGFFKRLITPDDEDLGQRQRPRGELEKFYAEDPNYEDVAAPLGL